MVYKKYVYKRGRKHGPYYYHSYRDGNSVRKIYIGGKDEYKKWAKKNKKRGFKKSGTTPNSILHKLKIILIILPILILLIIAGFFIYQAGITGRVGLNIKDYYIAGENITGDLRLNLKYGELLPIDSKLIIEQNGVVSEILLSNLILSNINGSFYVEDAEITGEGQGYGFIGEKITYPEVFFKLKIYASGEEPEDEPEGEIGGIEETPVEEPGEIEKPVKEIEEPTEEVPTEESKKEIPEKPVPKEKVEEEPELKEKPKELKKESEETKKIEEPLKEEVEEPKEESTEIGESPITGEAVKEGVRYVDGICSKDNDFIYELEQGKTAKIKKNSVEIEREDKKGKLKKEKIEDDAVKLKISGNQVVVSTDYSITEQGFGSDFLQNKKTYVDISLEKLGIQAQQGTLVIRLVYDGIELAEASKEISVISEEIPEIPIEENITEIENITEEVNITAPENITEVNITIPETNLTNVTIANETITNVTVVNETITNISALDITTKQYKAVINRPVKWIKTVKGEDLDKIKPLILELPKRAKNITIKTGKEVQEALDEIDDYEQVIEETDRKGFITGQVTGDVSLEIRRSKRLIIKFWEWLTSLTITGNIIYEDEIEGGVIETNNSKIIDLADIANQTQENEIGVEYYTDAPVSSEEDIFNGKRIIISASSELGYTEILAYSLLNNTVSMNDTDKMRVYWVRGVERTEEEQAEEVVQQEVEEIEEKGAEKIGNITENENVTSENITEIPEINETIINKTIINEETQNTSLITGEVISNFEDNEVVDNSNETVKLITKQKINFTAYDLDEDGFVDYIEWEVAYLSEQVYEIIYITKAEHLDENRGFISDIYEDVKEKDDNWSETIPEGHYVRVTFEKNLTSDKDITIYARRRANDSVIIDGKEVPYDVYEKKKRIDEIQRILFSLSDSLSVQFLPKELAIRGLLG